MSAKSAAAQDSTQTLPALSVEEKQHGADSSDDGSHVGIDRHTAQDIPMDQDDIDWSQYTLKRTPWRLSVTDFRQIVKAKYRGKGTSSDPFIVQWLDHDPENPKNYNLWFKCSLVFLVSLSCLSTSLASSAYTGASKHIIEAFHCSEEVFLIGLSLMVLGFAVGPLLWAPLSEAIGRRHVLLAALAFYTMWTGVCVAAQNIQTLIVFRFFCGTIGSAGMIVPGGQVADLFDAEQRGVAMAMFAAAPFLGPTVGPLIGGYLSDGAGWRWVFGLLTIFSTILTVLFTIFVPETYAPVLLRKRAALLTKATGQFYQTRIDLENPLVFHKMVRNALVLPWALLFREPVVFLLSVCFI